MDKESWNKVNYWKIKGKKISDRDKCEKFVDDINCLSCVFYKCSSPILGSKSAYYNSWQSPTLCFLQLLINHGVLVLNLSHKSFCLVLPPHLGWFNSDKPPSLLFIFSTMKELNLRLFYTWKYCRSYIYPQTLPKYTLASI